MARLGRGDSALLRISAPVWARSFYQLRAVPSDVYAAPRPPWQHHSLAACSQHGLALDFRQFRPAARSPRARQPGKSVHCLTAVIADPIQRVDHRVLRHRFLGVVPANRNCMWGAGALESPQPSSFLSFFRKNPKLIEASEAGTGSGGGTFIGAVSI